MLMKLVEGVGAFQSPTPIHHGSRALSIHMLTIIAGFEITNRVMAAKRKLNRILLTPKAITV
jgi:hypothetical protein